MTRKEFMNQIQAYYGVYPKGQLPYLADYLKNARGTFLDALFTLCIRKFSAKWRTPPDIAILEELKQEALDTEKKPVTGPNEYLQIEDDEQKEEYVSPERAQEFIDNMKKRFGFDLGGEEA